MSSHLKIILIIHRR